MSRLVLFGQVGKFNPDIEMVSTYLKRVDLFLEIINVADERKVTVLLTIIGAKDYTLLEGLLSLANPLRSPTTI